MDVVATVLESKVIQHTHQGRKFYWATCLQQREVVSARWGRGGMRSAGGKAREAETRQTMGGLTGHAEELSLYLTDSGEQGGHDKMIPFRKMASWRQSKA